MADQQDRQGRASYRTVQATDAEAAIRRAIEKFEIAPEQRGRIAARPIVVR